MLHIHSVRSESQKRSLSFSVNFLTDTNIRTGTTRTTTPTITKKPGVWQEIGSNIECDTTAGEKLIRTYSLYGESRNIERCIYLCDSRVECLTFTYLGRWPFGCSLYSTWCTKHKTSRKAVSMRWDISGLLLVCRVTTYILRVHGFALTFPTQIHIFLFNRCISAQSGVNRRRECSIFLVISNRHK